MGFGNILGPISLQQKSLAALPSAVDLRTGIVYEISDYGGNIATVVNGVWRFEYPFRTTWAGRPAVDLVPVGTEIQVTDYGNQKWINNGTVWRPAQGRAVLKELFGLSAVGGQIAQISKTASGLFSVPGECKIPVGMIIPHSRLCVQVDGYKSGANGTAKFAVYLGVSNSSADATMCIQVSNIASGVNVLTTAAARFGTAPDSFNTRNLLGEGVSSGSNSSMLDRFDNVNTNADMWLNVGVNTANAADVFNLVSLQVVLEA